MKKIFYLIIFNLFFILSCSNQTTNPSTNLVDSSKNIITVKKVPIDEVVNDNTNLVKNSTFDEEIDADGDTSLTNNMWSLSTNAGNTGGNAVATIENGICKINISNGGNEIYSVQLIQQPIKLEETYVYSAQFDAKADKDTKILLKIGSGEERKWQDYTGGSGHGIAVNLTPNMQTYEIQFVMNKPTDEKARFEFQLGKESTREIYLDNIKLKKIGRNNMEIVNNIPRKIVELPAKNIHINQLGYNPNDKKIVIINSTSELSTFNIVNADNAETVFTSNLTKKGFDNASGDNIYYGDFSEFKNTGNYYINVPNLDNSYSFKINENIYYDLKLSLEKMLYFQRASIDIEEKYASKWARKSGYTEKARVLNEDKYIDVSGGWFDAGDYGRYVVPAATTIGHLLLAYEFFPEKFNDNTNIPESGNGIADILDESRYALEWMLKMQREDGAVYHKVTTANFVGMIMPDKNDKELILSPISATATADFAAITAMASRYFKFDKEFSDKLLNASIKSWNWLENNSNVPGFKNPNGIVTGEYGDDFDLDERYWAAVELYATTKDSKYHDYIKSIFNKINNHISFGWADMGGFASTTYLLLNNDLQDSNILNSIKNEFIKHSDELVNISENEGYNITLKENEYIWGSNMKVMTDAMLLLITNDLINNNPKYIDTAKFNLDYLLGLNALDKSFISGFGKRPMINPHHRPSVADNIAEPIPGMISGGPNSGFQDDAIINNLSRNTPPARCYVDLDGSYSTNEITTYWNSPAIFVANYFIK
ncbi:MAG: endoglucanase [Fusobacteriaceae bacterium]|nr:endoglucanase [Fusobacteriaceae bacterium]